MNLPLAATPRPSATRRRVLHTLVPPRIFDFWAAHFGRTLSLDRPLAKIVAREAASADAVTLVFATNRHWKGCAPGQHVTVSAEIDGRRLSRSYSPTSVSKRAHRLAITVKAMDGGTFSQYLCTQAKVGDVVEIGPAFGAMALPDDSAAPLLFLAAGSGITPMMAMLRALAQGGAPTLVTLLYWARSRDQLCFVSELRALAARIPGFRVRFLLTGEAAVAADEGQGRIDAELVAAMVPDLGSRHVYACGPGGFVESARALTAAGAAAFQAEAFSLPPAKPAAGGHVRVELAHSGRTLSVPRGMSLLQALEAEGVKPASGCRMGLCNTCACGKRAGTTRHLLDGVTDPEPATALRICVNTADTDLILEL